MQYSTALSDGVLALACLASTLWLRPAFRWRTVQRVLLLGFGLPLSAALCGVVRYGLDPDWSNWHRTFSQLTRVDDESRVEEIARMLGGKAESARAHARSLLAGTG